MAAAGGEGPDCDNNVITNSFSVNVKCRTEQNSYRSSSGKILKMKVEREADRKPVSCSGVKRENWGKGVAKATKRTERTGDINNNYEAGLDNREGRR